MQQHLQQRIAIAFSSGENADTFEHIVTRKQKAPEQAAQLRLRRSAGQLAKVIEDASLGIEFLVLVLRKVVEMDFVPQFIFASTESLLLSQQLDQRGLPGPVDS